VSPLRRSVLVFGLVVAGTLSGGVASASASGKVCLPVFATGVGQDLGGGQTRADISSLGFMVGTSTAQFVPTPDSTPEVLVFTGSIVFSTALGMLTAPVNGTFDLGTGRFEANSNASVSGTGLLRGVTGTLNIHGTQTGIDFIERITGRLCLRT
jgi:hypothetical protein